MRIFEHFNKEGRQRACPICGKNEDKPVVLVILGDTIEDGLAEAKQYHVDCINLIYNNVGSGQDLIYQNFQSKEGE